MALLPSPFGNDPPHLERYWTTFLQPYWRSRALLSDPAAASRGEPLPGVTHLADYVLLTCRQGGRRGDPSEPRMRWPGPPLSLGQVVRPSETIQWMEGRTTTRESLGQTRRHDRGVNVVFADAHACWLPEKSFWSVRPEPDGFYWLLYGAADR